MVRISLVKFRIDTGRRGVKNISTAIFAACVQDIQVDERRIVHDVGIIFTGEDIAGASHIRSELVKLIIGGSEDIPAKFRVPQVTDDKFVRFGFTVFRVFQVNAFDPKVFPF